MFKKSDKLVTFTVPIIAPGSCHTATVQQFQNLLFKQESLFSNTAQLNQQGTSVSNLVSNEITGIGNKYYILLGKKLVRSQVQAGYSDSHLKSQNWEAEVGRYL